MCFQEDVLKSLEDTKPSVDQRYHEEIQKFTEEMQMSPEVSSSKTEITK